MTVHEAISRLIGKYLSLKNKEKNIYKKLSSAGSAKYRKLLEIFLLSRGWGFWKKTPPCNLLWQFTLGADINIEAFHCLVISAKKISYGTICENSCEQFIVIDGFICTILTMV